LSPLFSLVLGSSLEFLVQHYRIRIRYHIVVLFGSFLALYLPPSEIRKSKKTSLYNKEVIAAFNEFFDNGIKIRVLLDNSLDKSKIVAGV
jgi:hypothetical protein